MNLHHVTITTGHVARTPRADVSGDVVAALTPMLADMLAADPLFPPKTYAIPGRPPDDDGWILQSVTVRGADHPLFRVHGPIGPDPIPTEGRDLPCVVSFGVALTDGDAATALWRTLHDLEEQATPPATDPARPPDEWPWCAVALHRGLSLAPEAGAWLGDFERCIAWTAWTIRTRPSLRTSRRRRRRRWP